MTISVVETPGTYLDRGTRPMSRRIYHTDPHIGRTRNPVRQVPSEEKKDGDEGERTLSYAIFSSFILPKTCIISSAF